MAQRTSREPGSLKHSIRKPQRAFSARRRGLLFESLEARQLLAVTANDDPDIGGPFHVTEDTPFVNGIAPVNLVAAGSSWSYLDQITNGQSGTPTEGYPTDNAAEADATPGVSDAWNSRHFNTAGSAASIGAWSSGPAVLGAGTIGPPNIPVATTWSGNESATSANPNTVTTYLMRREIAVTQQVLNSNPAFTVNLLSDDGAVIFINGTEVLRHRVAAGPVATTTPASVVGVEAWENNVPFNAGVTNTTIRDLLVAGNNTIAVELHQLNTSSTDSAFDLSLTATSGSGVLANDNTGGAVGPAVLSVVTQPIHGTVSLDQAGIFTYTPHPNYTGPDSFVYRLADDVSNDTATVSLTVDAVNDPPVASNDVYSIDEDGSLAVSLPTAAFKARRATWTYLDEITNGQNGTPNESYPTDAEGDPWHSRNFNPATSTASVGPWKTAAAIHGNGTIDAGPLGTTMQGTAASHTTYLFRSTFNVTGAAAITQLQARLLADDGAALYINGARVLRHNIAGALADPILTSDFAGQAGDESAYLPFTLNVAGVLVEGANTLAVEVHQNNLTSTDVGFDLELTTVGAIHGLLANDFDFDGDAISQISLVAGSGPASGALQLNQNGTFSYTPNPNFAGNDSFAYTVTAGGQTSQPASVAIAVNSLPDNPVATADSYDVNQAAILSATGLEGVGANDSDPDGNPLTFSHNVASGPLHAEAFTFNTDGTFTYNPVNSYTGADSFTYTVSDGTGRSAIGTVSIQVTGTGFTVTATNPANSATLTTPPAQITVDFGANVLASSVQAGDLTINGQAATGVSVVDANTVAFTLPGGLSAGTHSVAIPAGTISSTSGGLNNAYGGGFTLILPPVLNNLSATGVTSSAATLRATVTDTGFANPSLRIYWGDNDAGTNAAAWDSFADLGTVGTGTFTSGISGLSASTNYFYRARGVNSAGTTWAAATANFSTPGAFAVVPRINEFMAENTGTFADEDSQFNDWIEISNPGTVPRDLTGWYLTDELAAPTKWQFPATTIPPGGYLIVWASNNDRRVPGQPLHTNFRLSNDGEFLALVQADGSTIASQYDPTYPLQTADRSYGLRVDDLQPDYFSPATPGAANTSGQLVINEIMYHPASELDADEWIELKNIGAEPVDATGWQLTAGVSYVLPSVIVPAGGYLVIAADPSGFLAAHPGYGGVVVGGWTGQLSNSGEGIELQSAIGQIIDRVEYADEGDWALRRAAGPGALGWDWIAAHDGGGSTIELVQPLLSNDQGQNWVASGALGGTPGVANGAADNNVAPLIQDVVHSPAVPRSTDPVIVRAELRDEAAGGFSANLFYRDHSTTSPGVYLSLPMFDDGTHGDLTAGDREFAATIGARPNGTVIEFYVRAVDAGGNARTWPAPSDDFETQGSNALYQVDDTVYNGPQAVYRLVMTETERAELESLDRSSNAAAHATVIQFDGSETNIRHNADLRYRGASSRFANPPTYHLNLSSDNKLNGAAAINLNSHYTYNQLIGSAIFRTNLLPAADATAVQLRINGINSTNAGSSQFGSYVAMEVIDSDFADRHFPDDSGGNAYRGIRNPIAELEYFGPDPANYVGPYDKLTNTSEADYDDIIYLTCVLSGAAVGACPDPDNLYDETGDTTYLDLVSNVINIDQWLKHVAIHTLISNNETTLANGFGDDYAMYRGTVDARFVLLPHDLDTIVGQGDSPGGVTDSLFRATQLPVMDRFLRHPQILPRYYQALTTLIETTFSPAKFNPLLDNVLGGFVPQGTINSMKSFQANRNAYVLSQIPRAQSVASSLPLVNGFPQSTASSTTQISGTADALVTEKVIVDGIASNWNPSTGSWSMTGTGVQETIVPTGSPWRYLDDGTDQGTAWRATSFPSAAGWPEGPSPLGYGDGDEATTVNCGPSAPDCNQDNFITTYFRHTFSVADPARYTDLTLRLNRDDGAAVYLNGTEIARDLLNPDALFSDPATGTVGGATENQFFSFSVPASRLVAGNNVLAVEVHQNNSTSSDISFDLELLGTLPGVGNSVTLLPGVNRVLVRELGAGDVEVGRTSIDIWYDDGSVVDLFGTINENTTLSAAGGPYRVTADLTVAAGSTLTIQPGTTIYFNAGTGITVNGRLVAEGTDGDHIRLRPIPGSTSPWDGIRFTNTTQDNRMAYVDIEHAESLGEAIRATNSVITLDHMTFSGTTSTVLELIGSSFHVKNSTFPALAATADDELIHGSGILAGGRAILEGNTFGAVTGHGDAIDFTGGQRPGPILQVLNNVFAGGGDDGIDLHGADAHIEGNRFEGFHKGNASASTSNAIAAGTGGGNASEITVARNTFVDNDHAVLVADQSFLMFANNTVVGSTIAAINFDEPSPVLPGAGALIEGTIFDDNASVFVNQAGTSLTVNFSLLPAGHVGLGTGNLDIAANPARLMEEEGIFYSLRAGSGGIGTGPNGIDMGANVAGWAHIAGEPPAMTSATTATLRVGGPGITHYRFALDAGAFGPETPVATPIALSGLSAGSHRVRVIGRNSAGVYQDAAGTPATLSQSWTVTAANINLRINEVLAINSSAVNHEGTFPDIIELFNYGTGSINLAGMAVTDDPAAPGKFVVPAGTTLAAAQYLRLYANDPDGTSGLHLGFNLNGKGETLYLYQSVGGPLVDSVAFGSQLPNLSIGRNSRHEWTLNTPTLGAANVVRRTGDPELVSINEWLASPDFLFNDDHIELYNADTMPVDLAGLYLTDDPVAAPNKHLISPLSFVPAGGWTLFVADDEQQAGPEHLNFNLQRELGLIGLFDATSEPIDIVIYGPQAADVSSGRNGDADPLYTRYSPPNLGSTNPITGAVITDLIGFADSWRYEQSGVDLGAAWRARNYAAELSWPTGAGLLAFEPDPLPEPVGTPLTLTADNSTYYFRKHFNFAGTVADIDELRIQTIMDDGAVIYLNGTEVLRLRMDAGAPNYLSFANGSVGNATYEGPFVLTPDIFGSLLTPGDNVLAVEVHQSNAGSSDVVWGMTLEAVDTSSSIPSPVPDLLDQLRITEVMFNPPTGQSTEFIELYNKGPAALPLAGIRLNGAVDFTFGALTLPAGGYTVVVEDLAAFRAKYGASIPVAGVYEGSLDNGDENVELALMEPFSARILDFTYEDDWYPATDGGDRSLVIRDPAGATSQWELQEGWRASFSLGGSPGGPDSPVLPTITVDPQLTNDRTPLLSGTVSDPTATIQITVGGNTYSGVNVGDGTWTLANNVISPALADGTHNVLARATNSVGSANDPTNGELVVDGTPPTVTVNSLSTGDTTPPLTGTVNDNTATVFITVSGRTYSAVNNGNGTWTLADNMIAPALAVGAYNVTAEAVDLAGNFGVDATTNELTITGGVDPLVAGLRIVELMYRPTGANAEYIELLNIGGTTLNLNGVTISQGVAFTFGAVNLPPNQRIVVVQNTAAFDALYENGITVAGTFTNTLSDTGEALRLSTPTAAIIHEFTYSSAWHPTTNGGGHSLVVANPAAAVSNWNNAAGWRASHDPLGSPGSVDRIAGDLNQQNQVGLADLAILQLRLGQSTTVGPTFGDLNRDGTVNRGDVAAMLRNYGRSTSAPASSPEPAAVITTPAPLAARPHAPSSRPHALRGDARHSRAAAVDFALADETLDSIGSVTLRASRRSGRSPRS